jgi:imidazolonepropionase-like amidohydrolase
MRGMMINTKVKKDWLLDTLKENRETHQAEFKEARTGFVDAAQRRLAAELDRMKSGRATSLRVHLQAPEDHTADYDLAIEMLERSVDHEIVLTSEQYQMLVKDEWSWSDQWILANSVYSPSLDTKALEKGLK